MEFGGGDGCGYLGLGLWLVKLRKTPVL